MIKWSSGFVIPVFLLLLSCTAGDGRKSEEIKGYYDIKGLVDKQIVMLDSISPILYKTAEINGILEKQQLVPDSLEWVKELEMLKELDLNEPNLIDVYHRNEKKFGAETVEYHSIDPEKTKVDLLTIQFAADNSIPIRIQAQVSDKNPLFALSRTLDFHFAKYGKSQMIDSYSINGWQKMMSLDTNRFRVACKLTYE